MTFWPDDRTELLKKLWGEGLSALAVKRAIMDQLGHDVSRNAVIGKVRRLNLPERANRSANLGPGSKRKPKPSILTADSLGFAAAKSRDPKPPPPLPPERETPVEVAPIDTRCTILDLTSTSCRWPIGDPRESSFRFCGCKTIEGLPYCGYHSRIAYRKAGEVEEAA